MCPINRESGGRHPVARKSLCIERPARVKVASVNFSTRGCSPPTSLPLCVGGVAAFVDRLYISSADDHRRRSCQTVLYRLLTGMSSVMAPILPHLGEDVWQTLPFETEGGQR